MTGLDVRIRREMSEALAAGPSTLATYSAAAIDSALADGVIAIVDRFESSGRLVYALVAPRVEPDRGHLVADSSGQLAVARPSAHPRYTKSYAIDQIGDVEELRRVAHLMWQAFSAAHWQVAHVIEALRGGPGGCIQCAQALDAADTLYACPAWHAKAAMVSSGFGSV